MTFDEAVDQIADQFDVDAPTASSWVNDRLKRMVAQARWLETQSTLAITVAGQAVYAIDPNLYVWLESVRVGSALYERVSREMLEQVQDPARGLTFNADGVYAEAGGPAIELWPVPAQDGAAITVDGVLQATTLEYGANTPLPLPDDLHGYLLYGARAEGFMVEEERADMAQLLEQQFQEGIGRLRSRAIGMAGGHFSITASVGGV